MEDQKDDWYGRIVERVKLDPLLLPAAAHHWPNEWYPPKTIEARELIWLRSIPPHYDEFMTGVSWFMSRFAARPTVVYCDALFNPRRFMDMDIYGVVRDLGEAALTIGLTRR